MVLQREKDAESRIYDGSKTINIVLEDIRVGDVVEHSFTRQGENPVLANHYYDNYNLGWAVPVREVYFRLLWPTQRPLFIKQRGATITPKTKVMGANTEYVWSVKDAKAIAEDANLPGWYDPYPWIQVSEMGTWQNVIRWALEDDARANRMTITERYAISNIWKTSRDEAGEKIEFYPNLILGHLSRIPNASRNMPLLLRTPSVCVK